MIKRFSQGGYSLIELVIYLALFVGISIIIINSLVTVMRTYSTAQAYRRLQTNGSFVMERVTREIRDAVSVETASSTFGTSPGVLTIETVDESNTTHTLTFSVVNGKVQISDNGTVGTLSTDEVTVSSLLFHHITGGSHDAVRVVLTLTTANGYILPATFYTTVSLRNNE